MKRHDKLAARRSDVSVRGYRRDSDIIILTIHAHTIAPPSYNAGPTRCSESKRTDNNEDDLFNERVENKIHANLILMGKQIYRGCSLPINLFVFNDDFSEDRKRREEF
jgi:hypothetical protein